MAGTVFARQWLFGATALLALGSVIAWNIYSEHRAIDARERERLSVQAKVIDENLGRQLTAMNSALDSIRNELPYLEAQKDGSAQIKSRLQAMREAIPGIRALTIFDADGTLTARSPDQFVGQNFRSRDYFQLALKGGNPNTLYVAPPFLAKTDEYVINMTKVLLDARGKFAGVISTSLDPGYFSTLLDSVRYAPDMTTSLIHADGKLFLSIPARPGIVGRNLARPGSFFSRHRDSGQKVTVMTGIVQVSGDERMMVQTTIKPAAVPMSVPLILAVSRDLPSIFASWRMDSYKQAVLFALVLLTTTSGLYFYQRRQRVYDRLVAIQEAEQKQAEAELRVAAAAFESQQGMIITDANGVILRVNKAFTETTGYTAEEAIGQTPRLLKSDRHDACFFAAMWQSIMEDGGWQGEIWDQRKNGEIYPKWLTITAVKADDGTVTHYVGADTDITERKLAEDEIMRLAFYDQLTQLPNRRLLLDRLGQALASSARSGRNGALLYIDLDNFKTLNDTRGHDKGDLLLQQVAQRIATCVREGDTAARLGGDEFVVMLEDLSGDPKETASQAEVVGEKILAALGRPYLLAGAENRSTPSIGITLFNGHQNSVEELLKQADLAMYQAKDAGGNTLRFFDPEMQVAVAQRAALEINLREAVQRQQFILYYQAQVLADGRPIGAEALLRWPHPQRGLVAPAEFIPLAEESGLILPLGRWVLEAACLQLTVWAAQPEMAHLTVAVNVSARQFHHKEFVDQVQEVLERTGADPRRLKLELTESLLVVNVEEVIAKMFALKLKGVGFSLDDFGTGYSSLSYLKRLPLDQLKIDKSFVRDVLIDRHDAAIAKTIIALAQNMGLDVMAEGVETGEQREFLASSGCHAYQGYLFSRPLPPADFEEYVKRA